MKTSIFKKYPKLLTGLLSSIIVGTFCFVLFKIVTFDVLQDYENGEKYSIIDKIIYQVRCNGSRNIRLRELKPNYTYIRTPHKKYDSLEFKEYKLRTDNNGIIKPSFIHKNPDLQIFFLGGSTTECETVDEKFRFPYLSGRMLEEKLKIKINSDNASKSGNNSLHSIDILLNKIIPLNPDIVVLMHNINDLSALFYEGNYWNDNKTIAPISCAKKDKNNKKKTDQWAISEWQSELLKNKAKRDKIVKDFEENLKIFIAINKAKNIIPVLMTQANRIEKDPNFATERNDKEIDSLYKNLYIRFNQSIRKIAKQQKVLLIDLAKKIPSDKKYIYDVVHFNQEGSILVANEIVKKLTPIVIKINQQKNK